MENYELNHTEKSINRLDSIRNANAKNSKKEGELYHTGRMEDYLEVIYELVRQKGYATTIDISEYLNVRSPSVTKMVKRLNGQGYLNYEKYRGISLTQQGTTVAKATCERHDLLTDFLKMIGVEEGVANKDAEGIEHHLDSETLKKLEDFVRVLKKNPKPA